MFQVESQGAVDVVNLQGPLISDSVEDLEKTLDSNLSGGQPMVVLNLTGVPLLDSAGLDALLDARDRINHLGGTVKLSGLTPLCEEVLRVTRVGSHFECHDGTKSAVGSFIQ